MTLTKILAVQVQKVTDLQSAEVNPATGGIDKRTLRKVARFHTVAYQRKGGKDTRFVVVTSLN